MVQPILDHRWTEPGKSPAGRKRQLNVMLRVSEFDNRVLANLSAEPSFYPDLKGCGWQD
jgi:hypothetical protein